MDVEDVEDQVKLKQYMESGKYLPPEMRDFHDAKDLFKAIGEREVGTNETINFRQGMVYTIDHFLWFMAMHGFELKRVRSNNKVPRHDLHETIKANREEMSRMLRQVLENRTEGAHADQGTEGPSGKVPDGPEGPNG